ncbi:MAG: hypothetical protein ABSD20_04315 [Terriglobales bacterium]|jgi:hypothetical protein
MGINGRARTTLQTCHCSAVLLLAAILLAGVPTVAQVQSSEEQGRPHKSIGFVAGDEASPEEVGLPVYPGARPHKDKDDDSSGANLGLWGGTFGFKLAVMKLESADAPEKVTAFYRKALAKYGPVLDCSNNAAKDKQKSDSSTKQLSCGDDRPDKGGMLFKSGTKQEQHIVGIKPDGTGTLFQLVFVEAHSSDSK